ncbi:MAG TPA: flagellar export chaperone FliS [Capsulimonadaceae bacterium]|nr:flagellar export chaperone FliS [Capsulimonadaceae bacterium]
MSLNNPYAQYRQTQIETATQSRLIIMLHDGAIRFLQQAIVAIKDKDYYHQSLYINKALAVVDHLWATLNLKDGGEIASALHKLFPYLRERLVYGNMKDDAAAIQEVLDHIRPLRDAWAAAEEIKSSAEPKPAAVEHERGELSMAA